MVSSSSAYSLCKRVGTEYEPGQMDSAVATVSLEEQGYNVRRFLQLQNQFIEWTVGKKKLCSRCKPVNSWKRIACTECEALKPGRQG